MAALLFAHPPPLPNERVIRQQTPKELQIEAVVSQTEVEPFNEVVLVWLFGGNKQLDRITIRLATLGTT